MDQFNPSYYIRSAVHLYDGEDCRGPANLGKRLFEGRLSLKKLMEHKDEINEFFGKDLTETLKSVKKGRTFYV